MPKVSKETVSLVQEMGSVTALNALSMAVTTLAQSSVQPLASTLYWGGNPPMTPINNAAGQHTYSSCANDVGSGCQRRNRRPGLRSARQRSLKRLGPCSDGASSSGIAKLGRLSPRFASMNPLNATAPN